MTHNYALMANTFVPTAIISVSTTTETDPTTRNTTRTTTNIVPTDTTAVISELAIETGIGRGSSETETALFH